MDTTHPPKKLVVITYNSHSRSFCASSKFFANSLNSPTTGWCAFHLPFPGFFVLVTLSPSMPKHTNQSRLHILPRNSPNELLHRHQSASPPARGTPEVNGGVRVALSPNVNVGGWRGGWCFGRASGLRVSGNNDSRCKGRTLKSFRLSRGLTGWGSEKNVLSSIMPLSIFWEAGGGWRSVNGIENNLG